MRPCIYIPNIFRGFSKHKQKLSKKEYLVAFHECYARLGELRSLVNQKPLVPVLALTATANKKTRNNIRESLCLQKQCIEIFLSPNRENIYINIVKINSNLQYTFNGLVNEIREKNISFDKTIVYCKSIKDCGRLFMHFKQELGNNGYPLYYEAVPHNLILLCITILLLLKTKKEHWIPSMIRMAHVNWCLPLLPFRWK